MQDKSTSALDDLEALFAEVLQSPTYKAKLAAKQAKNKKTGTKSSDVKKPSPYLAANATVASWNKHRTGYTAWVITERLVQMERRTCTCCGATHLEWAGELFVHSNGLAHATWLAPEAHGTRTDDLPIRTEIVGERPISACCECMDLEIPLTQPRQMQLEI